MIEHLQADGFAVVCFGDGKAVGLGTIGEVRKSTRTA
jgi:hypothetical protein